MLESRSLSSGGRIVAEAVYHLGSRNVTPSVSRPAARPVPSTNRQRATIAAKISRRSRVGVSLT